MTFMAGKKRFETGVYEHAARFLDDTPWRVSRDANLLSQAHAAAAAYYSSSNVVMGIDIYNIEAESLGAHVRPAEYFGAPVIDKPLFHDLTALHAALENCPTLRPGRFALVLEAAAQFKSAVPDTAVKIPVCGPVSLAAALSGLETIALASVTESALFIRVLDDLVSYLILWCEAIAREGHQIIVFDSVAAPPLFSPTSYELYILPPTKRLIKAAHATTKSPVSYFVGGNSALITEHLLCTGAGQLLCPYETDQAKFLDIAGAAPEIDIRVNIDSAVFLTSELGPALKQIKHAMALTSARKNAAIGTGVLPYHAVPETVRAVRDHVVMALDN